MAAAKTITSVGDAGFLVSITILVAYLRRMR